MVPVIMATCSDPRALLRAVRARDCRELGRLVANGADVNWVNEDGMSPLMMAARLGEVAVVTALLELGSDPSLVDQVGVRCGVRARVACGMAYAMCA